MACFETGLKKEVYFEGTNFVFNDFRILEASSTLEIDIFVIINFYILRNVINTDVFITKQLITNVFLRSFMEETVFLM